MSSVKVFNIRLLLEKNKKGIEGKMRKKGKSKVESSGRRNDKK